jgi:hypothetical protein
MKETAGKTQPDLRPLREFADEVVRQHHEFSEFHFLFYGPQARVDLLNAVATHFFGELFGIMLDRLVLGVSKLTDPAGSGSRTNLSLGYVHDGLVHDARYPKAEAEKLISQAMSVRQHLEVWRSKRIAHNDTSVALGLRDAGDVIPERIKEFYSVAERYLNLAQDKLGLGPCPISTPGIHGADELVKALKSAMVFEQLFERDPVTYMDHLQSSRYKDA